MKNFLELLVLQLIIIVLLLVFIGIISILPAIILYIFLPFKISYCISFLVIFAFVAFDIFLLSRIDCNEWIFKKRTI